MRPKDRKFLPGIPRIRLPETIQTKAESAHANQLPELKWELCVRARAKP